ncbi:hypothetical protein A5766_20680 [Gordonia sp. 852002-51296_SCH5728562-b]|nr:hypothetical protein A5766_20680 [Gordonia sp. 852002-51296_SCH5728562-b]
MQLAAVKMADLVIQLNGTLLHTVGVANPLSAAPLANIYSSWTSSGRTWRIKVGTQLGRRRSQLSIDNVLMRDWINRRTP